MKVTLEHRKPHPMDRPTGPNRIVSLSAALPFVKGKQGVIFHRPRNGQIFYRDGVLSHTAISFWCGGGCFIGQRSGERCGGELYDQLPDRAILCATCEGRAIGAGLLDARQINGRAVLFHPRGKRKQKPEPPEDYCI